MSTDRMAGLDAGSGSEGCSDVFSNVRSFQSKPLLTCSAMSGHFSLKPAVTCSAMSGNFSLKPAVTCSAMSGHFSLSLY